MNILKKFMSVLLVVCMLSLMALNTFASDIETHNIYSDMEEQYSIDVAYASREYGKTGTSEIIDVDYIIARSTNVVARGNEKQGDYTSAKHDAGLPGYSYKISFSWVANVDSQNNYYFVEIIDPQVTTYTNNAELSFAWDYYTYDLIRNTYDISDNGYYIEFYTDYEFSVADYDTSFNRTFTQTNTKRIYLENIM